jgi:hypothetical protein
MRYFRFNRILASNLATVPVSTLYYAPEDEAELKG